MKKFILITISFLPFIVFCQSVKHYTVSEGLPQSFVSGIVQGEEGYIWLGTRNGLVRFDGNDFKVFQHDPERKNSLSSNLIYSITEGCDNTLTVKYDSGGIDLFYTDTEKVENLISEEYFAKNNVQDNLWIITSNNSLWYVGRPGVLNLYEPRENSNNTRDFLFLDDTIRSVMENRKNQIWVLSQKSLHFFNFEKKHFENLDLPFKMNFTDAVPLTFDKPRLYEMNNGHLLWSDRDFLYEYNPSNKKFIKTSLPKTSSGSINYFSTAPDGKVYFIIDKDLFSYQENIQFEHKIPIDNPKEVKGFLIDKSGAVWVAIDTDGVYLIDFSYKFESFDYKEDFVIDLLKKYFKIDPKEIHQDLKEEKFALSPSYYLRSAKSNNKYYIAVNETIYWYNYNLQKGGKLPFLENVSKAGFNPIEGISLITPDEPIVIQSNGDISTFDKSRNTWTTIFNTNSFVQNIEPNGILYSNGILWISSRTKGLFYLDLVGKTMHSVPKNSLPVLNLIDLKIIKEKPHILWIGSYSGLIQFNTKTYTSKIFSTSEGLPDNTVYSILSDRDGNLWLGTNRGLCRFNTKNYTYKNFSIQHGLPLLEYNRHHKLYLSGEYLSFGGENKGVVFNPYSIEEDKFMPKTAITGIEVNNKRLETLMNIEALELSHEENNLAVKYSALQYNQPLDNNYRYRLVGYDKDNMWKNAGKRKQAIYTKLPPGEYIFEVNASNTSGEWSNKIKSMAIVITPPWWNNLWAWVFYILVSVFLIISFIKYKVKQKVIFQEVEIKRKEALKLKELDEVKTNFFSNVTHELRTPLSLIIGPAEQLKKQNKNKEDKKLLSLIVKNGKSLLDLTNQLLDLSKIEAGVLKPVYSNGDIGAIVEKVVQLNKEELKRKNIELIIENSLISKYVFSKEFLERILSNLISNAIKYNKDNGKINITLKPKPNEIVIKISDTGIGISSKHLPHIFERYYRDESVITSIPGSGIGLSFVAELVKLQNGSIEVRSETGKNSGTCFSISLPYMQLKPKEEDLLKNSVRKEKAEKSKLLLVEDNQDLRNFIARELSADFKIYTAKDGKEGLNLAIETIPDIVVSDIMMSKMNGYELCEQIKTNKLTSHIPVILLTAKADIESKIEGLSIGADDYVYKPFNLQELSLRVHNLINSKQQQREFVYKKLSRLSEPESTKSNTTENDRFLAEVHNILGLHLNDENFDVTELASALNMSRTSLHRKMKAVANTSTGQVIKIYRLKMAVQLLQKNYNISEVAFQAGFGSPSYFTKCFKEVYGLTPSQYNEKIKNNS